MYAVTYKNKILTDGQLYKKVWGHEPHYERFEYMIGKTKKDAKEKYMYGIDGCKNAWKQRIKGLEIQKIGVVE